MSQIVPGVLTDDEEEYAKRLKVAEHACNLVQIDIVDGKFANNLTVGVDVISKYAPKCMLEIQLMVVMPMNYIDELAKLPYVSKIIFPFEIGGDLNEYIYLIKRLGKQPGLSLNPDTEIASALHLFDDIELLLLMTGTPGFSGQKLGESTYERIRTAKRINHSLPLEVDIGVNFENAQKLAQAGADFLVSSSALYNEPDFKNAYDRMSKLASLK